MNVSKKGKKNIRTKFTTFSVWTRWLEKLFHEDKFNMNLRLSI